MSTTVSVVKMKSVDHEMHGQMFVPEAASMDIEEKVAMSYAIMKTVRDVALKVLTQHVPLVMMAIILGQIKTVPYHVHLTVSHAPQGHLAPNAKKVTLVKTAKSHALNTVQIIIVTKIQESVLLAARVDIRGTDAALCPKTVLNVIPI